MKPLDFVRTPKGAIAIITETGHNGDKASISFIGESASEKNAWWDDGELTIIDNLPSLLARNLCHPFGDGRKDALKCYPK